jgi:hypothetical protein
MTTNLIEGRVGWRRKCVKVLEGRKKIRSDVVKITNSWHCIVLAK